MQNNSIITGICSPEYFPIFLNYQQVFVYMNLINNILQIIPKPEMVSKLLIFGSLLSQP